MRRRFLKPLLLSLLSLLVVCPLVLTAGGADDKKDDKDKKEAADEKRAKDYARWKKTFLADNEKPERVHGVRLRATGAEVKLWRDVVLSGDYIGVKWTLDYDGPRLPLIILKPTMGGTSGQTVLEVYAEDKAQRNIYSVEVKSTRPGTPWAPSSPREWFLTIPKDRPASGEVWVSLNEVRNLFRKHKGVAPKEFDKPPAVLYLRVLHKPFDRGGDLDAWTGEVHSQLITLKLKKW